MDLRLIGLTRRYGGAAALDAVSVHVRSGDCYGFLGHNGAGKTTAMRIALGLERADAGCVVVDGFDAAAWPREARARMGGLIETPGFHGHLNGVANLATLARLQGLDRAGARREAQRVVESVGLSAAGDKPVRAYSQGMRQRLGIAQALLGSPRIVLLDEPMSGLDPEGIEEVRRLLRRLTRDEGTTVLLSSHQLGEIAGLCNRIGILRQGRMLVEEETSTLLEGETGWYALVTDDDAQAARLLDERGIASIPHPAGGLLVTLGDRSPGDVVRHLVARGVELRTWTPRPPSLEEIYLRFTQGGEPQVAAGASTIDVVERPRELRAPKLAACRVVGYELRRLTSSAAVPLMLALPALFAVGAVWSSHGRAAHDASEMGAGTLATASRYTAFYAIGSGLAGAVPVLLVVIAGLASQSLAGEESTGTLRNVLLRPMTRVDAAAGKAAALLLAAVVGFVVVAGASAAAAAHWFEFKDYGEILPNGAFFGDEGGRAELMWPALWRTLAMLVPVVASFAGVGLLAGALARSGAAALGLALAGIASLFALSAVAGAVRCDGWLPTAHAPWSSLGDESVVRLYMDKTEERSDSRDRYEGLHVVVPVAWTVAAFGAAAMILRRRSIR